MIETNPGFKHLLSPFQIGGMKLKNRFIFLPHLTGYAYDHGYGATGLFSERNVLHYVERAKGGAAAVTISQNVDPYYQMSNQYPLGADERNRDNFKRLADEAHRYDCRVITQLNQGGHDTLLNPPYMLIAPTQKPDPGSHFMAKEIEKEDMDMIKDYYVRSAVFQQGLGWDAVELKIAHDGLLRTFASPYFNLREDEYGGSYENRMRYPLEVIAAIRAGVGPEYPIGIRLCMDEFVPFGYSMSYGLRMAKTLEEHGVDYISVDAGVNSGSWYMQIPPSAVPLGYAVYLGAALKKAVDIPIIAACRINDPVQAETVLEESTADLVGMCRQLLCDPETPNKTMEGRLDDIRHCIACNDGCVGKDGIFVECIQNPAVGREKFFGTGTLKQAKERKTCMVVGAGVAGLKAAELLARRGHAIQVYEKTDKVGGQILLAEKIPTKNEMEEVYRYLKIQLRELGVPIHYGVEADMALVLRENPDVVITATGSYPLMPEWKGAGQSAVRITDVRSALQNVELIGEHVLVFDDNGFWQGGGFADYCLALGARVTVVTPDFFVGTLIEDSANVLLNQRLGEGGARVIPSANIAALQGGDVVIEHNFSKQREALTGIDTLVVCGKSLSDNRLYKQLKQTGREVYAVGDCLAPRAIEQAIMDCELLARKIGGDA